MEPDALSDIEERFDQLTLDAKLRLLERLVRRLRHGAFMDVTAFERDVQAMATDPDIQRELRATKS